MNRLLLSGIFLICAAVASANAQDCDTVTVRKVTGVDSFTLEDGTRIGLLGIMAPSSKAVTKDDCIEHLRYMIEGQTVCIARDTTVADAVGRTAQRLVYLRGALVNQRMIEDGYAVPSKTRHAQSNSFATALATAKQSGAGAHATERSSSVQCSGTTQKGHQCKRMTTSLSGRCWQHE